MCSLVIFTRLRKTLEGTELRRHLCVRRWLSDTPDPRAPIIAALAVAIPLRFSRERSPSSRPAGRTRRDVEALRSHFNAGTTLNWEVRCALKWDEVVTSGFAVLNWDPEPKWTPESGTTTGLHVCI